MAPEKRNSPSQNTNQRSRVVFYCLGPEIAAVEQHQETVTAGSSRGTFMIWKMVNTQDPVA